MCEEKIDWTARCLSCGKCCGLAVTASLHDVALVAKSLGISYRETWENYIVYYEKDHVLHMARAENGHCKLQEKDYTCRIYFKERPYICNLYFCDYDKGELSEPNWAAIYNPPEMKPLLKQRYNQLAVTAEYLARHKGVWNETDFTKCLEIGEKATQFSPTDRYDIANDPATGVLACYFYDCAACEQRHKCCASAAVTLADIMRISEARGMQTESFFQQYVSSGPVNGLLTLKTDDGAACPFFIEETNTCGVQTCQPADCQMMPCPLSEYSKSGLEFQQAMYFNAGTLIEQWEVNVAQAITRAYAEEASSSYNESLFKSCIRTYLDLIRDRNQFAEFLEMIKNMRDINNAHEEFKRRGNGTFKGQGLSWPEKLPG